MVGGGGTSQVIEQSLAMAHEFNSHLKGENQRIREQLAAANEETAALRAQLAQFEGAQRQLQQLQQLFNGSGGVSAGGAISSGQTRAISSPEKGAISQPTERQTAAANGGQGARLSAYSAQPTVQRERTQQTDQGYSDQVEREIANLIREIMQFNDQQAKDDSERWLINQSTLKQLTTRNQAIIKRVLEGQLADELQQHHDNYGLHGRMANRGKDIEHLVRSVSKSNCSFYIECENKKCTKANYHQHLPEDPVPILQ